MMFEQLARNAKSSVYQLVHGRTKAFATSAEFSPFKDKLQEGVRVPAKNRHYDIGTMCDPMFVVVVKRMKADFNLKNFVETGTYIGETSYFMSGIFERVYTCDVIDWPKPIPFHLRDNLVFEKSKSTDFLLKHLEEIKTRSMFFLDAHWGKNLPLRDEMQLIFNHCQNPVVLVDDFDAGNGLEYDVYGGQKLNMEYVEDILPKKYRFFKNTRSYRNRGMLFVFPDEVSYGCKVERRQDYDGQRDSLW